MVKKSNVTEVGDDEEDDDNASLAGILAAISVVSKRLARRLALIERKQKSIKERRNLK